MSLRPHVILAVFKRNFLSYFSSVIGYLFVVAFVGLMAFRAFTPEFFADNQATLDQLNGWFSLILLFIIPAWFWGLVMTLAFFPFLGLIFLVERYSAAHGLIGPEPPTESD